MIYSINEGCIPMNFKKNIADIEAVYTEGTIISDCSCFITEEMLKEYSYDKNVVRQAAILEGAKFDAFLNNWLKEGKDYKGLKNEVKSIIAANNMDKSELRSKGKGFMHTCKRILQICYDIDAVFMPVSAAASAAGTATSLGMLGVAMGTPAMLIYGIIIFVVNFIINRLMRYLVDTVEFNNIKKDAEDIVSDLRAKAKNADEAGAKKLNAEADKLEAAIKKYSKKGEK